MARMFDDHEFITTEDPVEKISMVLQSTLQHYVAIRRQSGETTQMIKNLKKGDYVVCLNSAMVKHMEKLIKERGSTTDVKCIPLSSADVILTNVKREHIKMDHTVAENLVADLLYLLDGKTLLTNHSTILSMLK